MAISSLHLNNYKSIQEVDISFGQCNIFIGANGAGKSNLLSVFDLIQCFTSHLQPVYITRTGGPDAYLRYGRKTSRSLSGTLHIADIPYHFSLEASEDDAMYFTEETIMNPEGNACLSRAGHKESLLFSESGRVPKPFLDEVSQWRTFHLNDTGGSSPIIRKQPIADTMYLRKDGSNVASFLYMLKERYPTNYRHIIRTVQRIAPSFSDFSFRLVGDLVEMLWLEKFSDIPLRLHLLSDGILRFICMATLLLQPKDIMPKTIIIDEPELGLHPFALNILAGLVRSVSADRQLIISTQSPEFLNAFSPEDIIVTDKNDGETTYKRLNPSALKIWIEKYALSELWLMNYLEGEIK